MSFVGMWGVLACVPLLGAPGATLPLPRSARPTKAKMSSKFGNCAMEQPLRALVLYVQLGFRPDVTF